jgi:MoaA/NifB/PqqE/SkfB family radical SAM enzyme
MKFEYLILEISSRCTAGCADCFRSDVPTEQGDMSREVFEAALAYVPPDTMVCAALLGESMLNPDYPHFLKRMKEMRLPVSVPASALTCEMIPYLVANDSPVYSILVSTDGITEHSQSAHRGKITLDMVKRFISELKTAKDHKLRPLIGVRMVDNGQSEMEFERYLRYWLLTQNLDMVVKARNLRLGMPRYNSPQLAEKCRVLTKNIPAIMFNGDVLLCERVPNRKDFVIGNVLRDTWATIFARRDKLVENWPYCAPCEFCSAAVIASGFQGIVALRNAPDIPIYMHSDHYQTFYSLEKKWSGISWRINDGD